MLHSLHPKQVLEEVARCQDEMFVMKCEFGKSYDKYKNVNISVHRIAKCWTPNDPPTEVSNTALDFSFKSEKPVGHLICLMVYEREELQQQLFL